MAAGTSSRIAEIGASGSCCWALIDPAGRLVRVRHPAGQQLVEDDRRRLYRSLRSSARPSDCSGAM